MVALLEEAFQQVARPTSQSRALDQRPMRPPLRCLWMLSGSLDRPLPSPADI